MTRRGKIARLPRTIREELNKRLDNGERGRRVLEWLNELPEVKEVLKQETKEGIRKQFEEWAADTDFREHITPKMTKEEKDRALYRLIYGRDEDEVAENEEEAKNPMPEGETSTSAGNSDGVN